MTDKTIIVANPVHARLVNATRDQNLIAYEKLSFIKSDGMGYETRESLFDMGTGLFPTGFAKTLAKTFKNLGMPIPLRMKSAPEPKGPPVDKAYLDVNPFGFSERYAYQPEAVKRLIRERSMIARIATGGGKSLISRTAVRAIGLPSLFLTTRQVLMYQMKEGYESVGIRTGVIGDGEWAPRRGCNVGMVQTLYARLSNPKTRAETEALLKSFNLVIMEEAHEGSSDSFMSVMNCMTNAHYRLALTATPFMRSDEEANMRLMGVAGRVAVKVSEKELIERGILAKPYFMYYRPKMPKSLLPSTAWASAYKLGIVENEDRNSAIVKYVNSACVFGLSSMVLVQRKAHGELLKQLLKEKGVRAEFIYGENNQKQRQAALKALGEGRIDCLIGSTILDVGVDVPAVGLIVLAGGGKAEVALRQRIGRGLREKKSGPNVCIVVDFEDNKSRTLRQHYRARRGIVESTPGFGENILQKSDDIPFKKLGFVEA